MIKVDVRKAVDDTLAPGAPKANWKYLVDVGVGGPNTDKAGLPLPVGTKISNAFKKVGIVYTTGKKVSLQQTSPGPLDIRHAQVVAKYEEKKIRSPNYTEIHISEKIVIFFNQSSDVSGFPGISAESI